MTEPERAEPSPHPTERRMQLRYGVTEAESWRDFALSPQREQICARFRDIGSRIISIFLFDKGAPDPVAKWDLFAASVQAVLNVGAVPMITFAKFPCSFDDPRAVRWFANQCADVVWSCIEQWGGEVVRDWYWCVWNEPNSEWIGGGLTFEQYRRIYEEVAQAILRWLAPYLGGRKPLIGGPAVNGFLPFWMDWIWQCVNEIDNSLIGFVNWHRYGDWREPGEWVAPRDEATYRALLMSRTPDYEACARAVGQLLNGRDILNICGELNTHSHHEPRVSGRFNQTIFGAAFYTSALLHLMRGGADAEIFRSGTDDTGRYGMLDKNATPTPVFHAKKLCAQFIHYGDRILFPTRERGIPSMDAVIARGEDGRRSALFVHLKDEAATYEVSELAGGLGDCRTLLKIDGGTGNEVLETSCDGTIRFDGYGVAVVTNLVPVFCQKPT